MLSSFRAALAVIIVVLCGSALAAPKAVTSAAAPPTLAFDSCSWDKPGVNPFMGDLVAAVDRYQDIPVDIRERLKARMAKRDYDDMVSIRRDTISGHVQGREYSPVISEMHFGTHQLCHSVTRQNWTPAMQERGLVYCEGSQCILVPTVCRNVSRISRREVSPEHADALDVDGPIAVVDAPRIDDALALDQAPSFATPFAGGWLNRGSLFDGGHDMVVGMLGGAIGSSNVIGSGGSSGVGGSGISGVSSPLSVSDNRGDTVAAVPEPQTWALLGLGLAAVFIARRRARRLAKLARFSGRR